MGDVAYRSVVEVERIKGPMRQAWLPALTEPITFGVHSAMPMFKAKRLCPDAVVIKPNMAKYATVAREVRARMRELTPLVEPVSIDEAFLDLSGTERLHGRSAAQSLASFAAAVEREIGITISIGLSYNKFLAKIASDLDKPRGFAMLGRAEAPSFLAPKPISTAVPSPSPVGTTRRCGSGTCARAVPSARRSRARARRCSPSRPPSSTAAR